MKVQEKYRVLDYRNVKELGLNTISGYKRSDVTKTLMNTFKTGLIENACYWSAELISSGKIKELQDIIIQFTSKNININNPNLPFHLWNIIKNINNNFDLNDKDILNLRNNQEIRNIFCELVVIMCTSTKNEIIPLIPIKEYEFEIDFFREKLKATDYNLINDIIEGGDPSEMSMIANELYYNLHNNNLQNSNYWLSWIIEWEKINIKKTKGYRCANRYKYTKIDKYATDVIWLICDILLNEVTKYRSKEKQVNVISLINIFRQNFTSNNKYKKLFLISHAILIIISEINFDVSVYKSYPIILQASCNINFIYQNIKTQKEVIKSEELYNEDNFINKKSETNVEIFKKQEKNLPKKKKKGEISSKSLNKLLLLKEIDQY